MIQEVVITWCSDDRISGTSGVLVTRYRPTAIECSICKDKITRGDQYLRSIGGNICLGCATYDNGDDVRA